MPRGDKSKYTDKQKRKARHIEEGYEQSGLSEKEAERRAWATVKQGDWRRQQERFGSRRAGYERLGAQRWTHRWEEIGCAASGGSLGFGS